MADKKFSLKVTGLGDVLAPNGGVIGKKRSHTQHNYNIFWVAHRTQQVVSVCRVADLVGSFFLRARLSSNFEECKFWVFCGGSAVSHATFVGRLGAGSAPGGVLLHASSRNHPFEGTMRELHAICPFHLLVGFVLLLQ